MTPEEIVAAASPEQKVFVAHRFAEHLTQHHQIDAAKLAVALTTAYPDVGAAARLFTMYLAERSACPWCIFDVVTELASMARGLADSFLCDEHVRDFFRDTGQMLAEREGEGS